MAISCSLLLLYAAGSCANRCDAPFHDNTGGCYCHETCMFTDDCCDDYRVECREATTQPFWSVFTARKQSLGQVNIFAHLCHSVHNRGGIPACIAGGIPACLAGLQRGGIPACLAGLQGGGIPACFAGLQAHTNGGWS